jgi:hypothetical protein
MMNTVTCVTQKENTMARPVGLTAKLKNNSNKNFRAREEWMKGKKIGRPQQVFFDAKAVELKVIESLTDSQLLALPKSGWQKVSA